MTSTKFSSLSRRGAAVLAALALVLVLFSGRAMAQENPAPTVDSRSPEGTAQPSENVTATFSGPMNPDTINASTFTLTRAGEPVGASVAYEGPDAPANTAILDPENDLVEGASYTASISTGAQSASGVPLGAAESWGFTVDDVTEPGITLDSPRAGDEVGDPVRVRATASDNLGVDRVEFFVDGTFRQADTEADPGGVYAATISLNGFGNGTEHSVTATAYDGAENSASATADPVLLDNAVNLALGATPGENGFVNAAPALSFDTDEDVAAADRTCRTLRAGTTVDTTAPCVPPYSPTLAQDGEYAYRVEVIDNVGNTNSATRSFTLDRTSPALTIGGGPVDGEIFAGGSTQTWNFAASDATAGLSGVQCSVVAGGADPAYNDCSTDASHTVSGRPDGPYEFRVRATDRAGNETVLSRSFTIDARAPSLGISGPAEGQKVGRTVSISATASDTPAGVAGVAFLVNGAVREADTAAPFAADLNLGDLAHGSSPTILVRATDEVGNVAEISRTVNLDLRVSPPTLGDTPAADGFTNAASAPLSFTADPDVPAGGRECRATRAGTAAGPFAPCASPFSPDLSQDGRYTYEVGVTDDVGNTSLASRAFTLDRTDPTLSLTGGPDGGTFAGDTTQTWNFSRSDATSGIAGVQCSVVAGGAQPVYESCSTGTSHTVQNKPDGTYTFSVRATDRAGNRSVFTAAPYRIDATRPTVNLSAPVGGARIGKSLALAATAADDVAAPKVEFLVDGVLRRTVAAAPYEAALDTQGLGDGPHTVAARSVDGVGNFSTVAQARITVDRTAPGLTLGATPANGTITEKAVLPLPFEVTAGPADASVQTECRTYPAGGTAGEFVSCASPYAPEISEDGRHVYEIRATDDVGNTVSAPQRTFTFDRTAPAITLNGPEDGALVGPNGNMTWTIDGEDLTTPIDQVRCDVAPANEAPVYGACTTMSLNRAARAAAGTHTSSNAGRADGDYAFSVRAVDGAGNEFVASRGFTVDRTPPAVEITSGPEDGFSTNRGDAEWTFTSAEPDAAFECRVYGDGTTPTPFGACSGEGRHAVSGLPPGDYVFEVRGIDTFGNKLDGPSARRLFAVDVTAPRVLGFTPKNRSTVAPTANVTATFSEDMDAPTLGRTSFKITRAGSAGPIAASLSFNHTTNKATLNPLAPLQRGATYKVTISAGAKDKAGNPLAVGKTWMFVVRG